MDLLLSEEEQMLKSTVRDFAQRELAPRAAQWDDEKEFPWENVRGLASLGLFGITIPQEVGGSGGGYKELAIAIEEIAKACPSTSVIYISQLSLATATIERFGTTGQRQRFVTPLAQGQKLAAWCLTEPGNGSDAAALATMATKKEGGYILNGTKHFITNADVADTLVVFATQDRALRHRGVIVLVVEKGTKGLTVTPQKGKLGMRGSTTAEVVFQDCPVTQENRLGEEGQGFKIAMNILDSSRISIAAQCVGIAQGALEVAGRYSKQRQAFGQPIANFQAIQWMIADMATETDAARLLTYRAALLKDKGLPHGTESSMAKLFASEVAMRAADRAVQIHGGYGYFRPNPAERMFRDARVTGIYEGTSEVQRLVISRNVLSSIVV